MDVEHPVKTREFQNHHFDSTMWNGFKFRDGDVVISTYAKSGTTWGQQIAAQLIFNGAEINVGPMSPWVDLRFPSKETKMKELEAQTHRRILKTHLPVDALVFSPKAKYIYVARDGRDVLWSLYNHHKNVTADVYALINDTPGRVGPAYPVVQSEILEYWQDWFENHGHPWWPFWENVRSWWAIRHLPNVHMVHFADLKKGLPKEIRRIAEFLHVPVDEETWDTIVEHCTFEWMKKNASRVVPPAGAVFENGPAAFIYKGSNGRWRDMLSKEQCEAYEAKAIDELGEQCAAWLLNGGPFS